MILSERLKIAREKAGLSQGQLAKAIGIKQPSVAALESGKAKTTSHMVALARVLGVSAQWLAGEPDASPEPTLPPGEVMTPAPMLHRQDMPLDVPVMGTAVGGTTGDFSLNGEIVDYVRRPPSLAHARTAFAIFYANDSMFPAYEHGDPLYINPNRHPAVGDNILIEMKAEKDGSPGAAYVKRLVKKTDRFLIVAQFNPPRDDIRFDLAKIKGYWRIVPTKELLAI